MILKSLLHPHSELDNRKKVLRMIKIILTKYTKLLDKKIIFLQPS
ncbi:hypothetical protein P689_11932 [Candidatus Riesia pediculischaeffi PTSU]|uniref:Uncharacterized protein n=1 Tax=Candidatus Riesia pediculischaeffi PTSU TaxID=1401651 RepID=A0A0C1S9T5_9ENTR|nr:hypothetical protein P689_11932 [Candidatus Riesia pediculischaeffi PTSU]